MPSSISSSDSRHWALAWCGALLLALLLLGGWEGLWRARGLEPGLIDSPQAWSLQRERVYDEVLRPVVFLGASRSVYGLDPKVWKALRPGDKPVMLAINGHYPVAALRDLANDAAFHGLVIVDIDSYGLLATHHDMQQPWIDYYHHRWNPNWHAHRLLLNVWQRSSVLSNPGTGLWPVLKRALGDGMFVLPYSDSGSNRAGSMRFDSVDTTALAAHFDAEIDWKIARFPAPDPAQFESEVASLLPMIAAIRARGGDVVFVALPLQGRLVEMETRYMPRERYWDRFAALPHMRALHYADVQEWRSLQLPDRSHVRAEDRSTLTRGLLQDLERRGWLTPP